MEEGGKTLLKELDCCHTDPILYKNRKCDADLQRDFNPIDQ
jgi:hypothetical protein